MRSSCLRSCRKALLSVLSYATLGSVLILGASVICVLLLPVARDITHSLGASHRAEIQKSPAVSAEMSPQPAAGIASSPWPAFLIAPPDTSDDDSRDIDVTRVR